MSEIRRARLDDATAIASVWLQSRKAAPIPSATHSDQQVHAWFADKLVPSGEVWVITDGGEILAMMVLSDGWVEQLYVSPAHQQQGHGSRLLELAQSEQDPLRLWTFVSNLPAQRFYEAHGFTPAGPPSDENEERAPALLYRWTRAVRSS